MRSGQRNENRGATKASIFIPSPRSLGNYPRVCSESFPDPRYM